MSDALIKNSLSHDFIVLDPKVTVEQALKQLGQKTYGVIADPQAELPILVTAGVLKRFSAQQVTIGTMAAALPRPAPVQPDARLDQVASVLATDLVANPDLAGLLVWDDHQKVVGILPRQILARVAARLIERGGDTGRLEGASTVTGIYFYCPIDNEEKLVSYYDPANPPKCSNNHLMKRKPRS